MMNSMQPSNVLARTRLGSTTKKIVTLLLAAVMFLSLGVAGVMVGKAASTPPTPEKEINSTGQYSYGDCINFTSADEAYLKSISSVTVNGTPYKKGTSQYDTGYSSNTWYTQASSYFGYRLNLSYDLPWPATIIISANGYDDLILNLDENGNISAGPTNTTITIHKIWDDGQSKHSRDQVQFQVIYKDDSSVAATGSLSSSNSWSTDIDVEDGREIQVEETSTINGYSSSVSGPEIITEEKTIWTQTDSPSSGKKYLIAYVDGNTATLLGAESSTSGEGIDKTTIPVANGTIESSIEDRFQWIPNGDISSSATQLINVARKNTNSQNQHLYWDDPIDNDGFYSLFVRTTSGDKYRYYSKSHQLYNSSYYVQYINNKWAIKNTSYPSDYKIYFFEENTTVTSTTTYTITNTPTSVTPTESTYTLTYDANGGSGAPSVESKTDANSTKEFTVNSTQPTREGYDFLGWADSATATTANYQPGASISLTGDKTLYAVWKEQEKPVEDPVPEFHKSITKSSGTDEYVLNLNVTGETVKGSSSSSTITTGGKLDLIVVADQSYSMYKKDSSMDDGYGNALYQDEAVRRLLARYGESEGILYDILDDNDARIAFITFSNAATDQGDGWMTDKSSVYSAVSKYQASYGSETNIEAGLATANDLLRSARSDAKKAIIFLSDGDPNVYMENGATVKASSQYDETAAQKALDQAKITKNLVDDAYVIGYAYQDSGHEFLDKLTDTLNGEQLTANNAQLLKEKLNTIKETITTTTTTDDKYLKNVSISDTLSDNVVLNSTTKDVTVIGPDGKAVSTSDYTVAQNGKTITVTFKDSVAMKEGETYTVNIPVKPSDTPYTSYKSTAS